MMIQGNYARAAVARLMKEYDGEAPEDLAKALREILLWVDMVERKVEQVEVEARRKGFWP